MNIQLQFALTPEDYYEFQRAYMKHRRSLVPRGQRGLRSARIAIWLVVVGILVGFIFITEWLTPGSPAPVPAGPAAPVALKESVLTLAPYVILFFVVWFFFLWMARSRFLYRRLAAEGTKLGQPKTAELTEVQITIRQSHSYAVMEWAHFIRCIETPNTFLLFEIPRLAHILPKRGFASAEAIEEFRAFAQAHIGNEPRGFPVQPPAMPPGTRDG